MENDSRDPLFKRVFDWLSGERNHRFLGSVKAIATLLAGAVTAAITTWLWFSGSSSSPPSKAPTDELASKGEHWPNPDLFMLPDKVKPKERPHGSQEPERKRQWPEEPMTPELL